MMCKTNRLRELCVVAGVVTVLMVIPFSLRPRGGAEAVAASVVEVSSSETVASESANPTVPPSSGTRATEMHEETARPLLNLTSMMPSWMKRELVATLTIGQLLFVFVFVLLGLVLKKVSDFTLEKKLIPYLKTTRVDFDYLVATAASKPVGYLLLIMGLAGACAVLPLPTKVALLVFGAIKVVASADVIWFLFRIVDVVAEYLARLTRRTESQLDDQLIPLLSKALKVTVVLVGAVTALQVLGINVTGLVAGLGIGGLAVALGLQDTLANFFGSVFIFIDRPFAVGDWIKVGDVEGTVTEVGFRSTRIETFPKTVVTIPNKTVANAVIDNKSRMPKRRVMQTIGVTYETTAQQMTEVVEAIRKTLENDDGVHQEYIVVRFTEFADSSLNILVYYFTKATAYADHLATKERVNLAIMRAIDELGLSIAFPTQTVYFEGDIAKSLAGQTANPAGTTTAVDTRRDETTTS